MFKKAVEKLTKNKFVVSGMVSSMVVSSTVMAFAIDPTPAPAGTSLISEQTKTMIQNFAMSMPATILDLLVILVPTGLTCWGISLGVKKGIGWLQKKGGGAL